MAPNGGPYEDQQSVAFVSSPDGGLGLESSKQLSPPSDSSDLAWNRYRASFPTQDNEVGIQGKRRGSRLLDSLLTLSLVGGRHRGGMESPQNPNLSD